MMTLTAGSIAFTTAATAIIAGNVDQRSLFFQNIGSTTAYLGGSGNVASGTGFPIYAGETLDARDYVGSWFGCTSAGSASITYLRQS